MIRRIVYIFGPVFVILTYGVFLSLFELKVLPTEIQSQNPQGFYDYKGVVNVNYHFERDPSSADDILAAARDAELDFVSLSMLNTTRKPPQVEGYHDNVLVFVDGEYSYLDSRIMNFNSSTYKHVQGPGQSQVLFADLLTQKNRSPEYGFFILAHPFKRGYSWTGDYPIGLDGVEVINLKKIWEDAWLHSKASFLWTLFSYIFNPDLSLIRLFTMPNQEIDLWDKLSARRPVIGIAGTNADANKIPSLQRLFQFVRNHVLLQSELTGDATSDRQKVMKALHTGQFYMSLDALGQAKGFNAVIHDSRDRIFPMGSHVPFREGLELKVTLPQKPLVPFETILIKDGEKMAASNSQVTNFRLYGPGAYRVVVRVIPTLPLPDGRKWIPWIFSNHFYLK